MKSRMIQIVIALGLMAATVMTQASVLPEFMNARQLVAWRAQHSAPVAAVQASDEPTLFFTGKPFDSTSGTYLFKYRSYSPTLARWTSADPSGFPDGANNFQYCLNYPTGFKDKNGLKYTVAGTDADIANFKNAVLPNLANSGPTGQALVNALNSADYNVAIDISPNNNASSDSGASTGPGVPTTNPTISLNSANANYASTQQNEGAAAWGEGTSSPAAVLAHELGHALLDLDELGDVALIENPVRLDVGEDQRSSYEGTPLGDLAAEDPTKLVNETFKVNKFLSKYATKTKSE